MFYHGTIILIVHIIVPWFYRDHAQCDLLFKSLQISKQILQAKTSPYNNSTVKWKSRVVFMFFKFYGSYKTKSTFLLIKYIVCQKY